MAKKETVNLLDFTSKSGEKYKFQKVKPIAWLELMDEAEVNGAPKRAKLYRAVLENVVVQPQLTVNDFEDMAELDEVVTAAIRFQQGK